MLSQDCYTTFCGLYSHELYERPIYERTLPSTSFIESELPTEFEALKESPELTVNTKTGSVKFNSVSDQHNSLLWNNSVLQPPAIGQQHPCF